MSGILWESIHPRNPPQFLWNDTWLTTAWLSCRSAGWESMATKERKRICCRSDKFLEAWRKLGENKASTDMWWHDRPVGGDRSFPSITFIPKLHLCDFDYDSDKKKAELCLGRIQLSVFYKTYHSHITKIAVLKVCTTDVCQTKCYKNCGTKNKYSHS